MSSRFEDLVTVYEPTEGTHGPVINWVMFPGFSGVAQLEYTISWSPRIRHAKSVLAGLPTDRLIVVDLPPVEELPAFALWLLQWLYELPGDGTVMGGLSLGGWLANRIYRIAQNLPEGARPKHLGLVMISTPATKMELRPVIRLLAAIGQHVGPLLRTRLFRATFIRPSERKRIKREVGLEVLDFMKESVKISSSWWHRTLREVTLMDGLGPALRPFGEVFSINLEDPRDDDVLLVTAALEAIQAAYPGCENFPVPGLTRHGTLMQDGEFYQQTFQELHDRFVITWGLAA